MLEGSLKSHAVIMKLHPLIIVHKNQWKKLYTSKWPLDLTSPKWEECDNFVLSFDGYLSTRIPNFCSTASPIAEPFSLESCL